MKYLCFAIVAILSTNLCAQEALPAEKGFDTVVMKSQAHILKSGDVTTDVELQFVIKTELGRTLLSNFRINFFGEKDNFKLIEAYSDLSGIKSFTPKSDIKVLEQQSLNFGINDAKTAVIPISNLKINSIVNLKYSTTEKALFPGVANYQLSVTNAELAANEEYSVDSVLPIDSVSFGSAAYYQVIKSTENEKQIIKVIPTKLAWQDRGKNVNEISLFVSTKENWSDLNAKLSAEYEKKLRQSIPKDLSYIVSEAAKKNGIKEQIAYVTQEISKNISYSGEWTNNNRKFFPQDFKILDKSKKGDCKDFASIFVAMMRELKYESYPVLTHRSLNLSQIKKVSLSGLPQLQIFNHAIALVKDASGKSWWVDPTNPVTVPGVVFFDIAGSFAFILDGKENKVNFIPEDESTATVSTFEQYLKVSPDDTVSVEGKLKQNEASYNVLAQLERLGGDGALKKLFNLTLAPTSQVEIDLKKEIVKDRPVPEFRYSYIQKNRVFKNEKNSSVQIIHPGYLSLMTIKLKTNTMLGAIGDFTIITHIAGQQTSDIYGSECLAVSPWLNFSRKIKNSNGDIVVTDTVKTKKSLISEEESFGEMFEYYVSELQNCIKKNNVSLQKELAVESDNAKILGPEIEKMDYRAAENLLSIGGSALAGKAAYKAMDFSDYKLEQNPLDVKAKIVKALAYETMGYLNEDNYAPAYIAEAQNVLATITSDEAQAFSADVSAAHVYIDMRAADEKKILNDIANYNKAAKKDYEYYRLNAVVAMRMNNYAYAESWLKAAEPLALSLEQKGSFFSAQRRLYVFQKKYAKVVEIYKKMTQLDPKNAWYFNNLSAFQLKINDVEGAIESAKKALEISDFGMARMNLADAYFQKAINLTTYDRAKVVVRNNQKAGERSPANVKPEGTIISDEAWLKEERVKYISEALKAYPNHEQALIYMIGIYKVAYKSSKSSEDKAKAKHYSEELLSYYPDKAGLRMFIFQD